MSTTNKFILQNLALRAAGLTKVPPYWLFRENNFFGKNLGYIQGGKTIPDSSGFDVTKITEEELEDIVRTNALGVPMVMPLRFQLEEAGAEEWLVPGGADDKRQRTKYTDAPPCVERKGERQHQGTLDAR